MCDTPNTRESLRRYLQETFDLRIPEISTITGHNAPFDYLCHAYLTDFQPPDAKAPPDPIVWANRGGGKTFLGALATLLDLFFKPGIEVRILGGSMEQSKRMHAHLRRLLDARKRPDLVERYEPVFGAASLTLKSNGSCVELLSQSQTSVRGTRVQKLRCDEVELFKREIWEAAQLVTMSRDCGGIYARSCIECLSTMHLPHGLMFDIIKEARAGRRKLYKWGVVDVLAFCGDERKCHASDWESLHDADDEEQGSEPEKRVDCPLLPECKGAAKDAERIAGHITIPDAITLKSRVSQATWNSEMLCLHPRRTDSVFPEFDPKVHIVDSDPPPDPAPSGAQSQVVCGMDFGFRCPTVVLWGVVDDAGVLTILDERHESGALVRENIAAIVEGRGRRQSSGGARWPLPKWIGVDPSGGNRNDQSGVSNIERMREAKLTVRDRRMKIEPGVELIRARLRPATPDAPPRLFIHRRCDKLIEAMERYHFDAKNPDREKPVKDGSDHAADALRYLVQNLDRPSKTTRGTYV